MPDPSTPPGAAGDPLEVGAYCRRVEEHLTRVNEGHLVRIVGPAFELVRQWAQDGVPLSVVVHGIERKAERHRHGHARRPLRIEFCEADVREAFDDWRRAVGISAGAGPDADADDPAAAGEAPAARKPSLTKHLDRVVERLVTLGGRLDVPEALRDRVTAVLADVVALRDRARSARGPARDAIAAALEPMDRSLIAAARDAVDATMIEALARDAAAELDPYRARLAPEAWRRAVDATVERLLRERLRIPTLAP